MCFRILGVLLAVILLLLVQGIKLPSGKNEDVIVNCVLQATIKFFQHGSPVAVVPQIIDTIDDDHDSDKVYKTQNITFDTDMKCVQQPTKLEGNLLSKYYDVSTFNIQSIFILSLSYIAERSLGKLHSSEVWSLFVASSRNIVPLNTFKSYIIFVPDEEFVEYLIHWCVLLNTDGKFVLVFSKAANENMYAMGVLLELEFACYKDNLILIWNRNSDRVYVKTVLPYTPPYGLCGKVRQLINLDVWIQDGNEGSFQRNVDFRLNKIPHKLKCCEIKNTYLHFFAPPYNFIESTSENGQKYDGVDIRIIAHINDEITDIENCDEQSTIFVHNTILIRVSTVIDQKVAYPYHSLTYSYFVLRAGTNPRWTWFTAVFNKILWMIFFVTLGLIAVVMRWMSSSRLILHSCYYKNTIYCLLIAWSVFLGQGANNIPENMKFRIVFLTWIIFTLCVSTVLQSYVTSFFVFQVKEHQIDSPEELSDQQYTVIYDSLLKMLAFYNDSIPSICILSFKHAFQYAVNTPKTALYSTEEFFKYNERNWCKNDEIPRYHKFKHYEDSNNFDGLLFNVDGVLQYKMDHVLQKLATGGIIQKIFNDVVDPSGRNILSERYSELEYEPMELGYLQSCFYCLFCGLSVSLIVFCLEIGLKGRCGYFLITLKRF